MWDLRGSCCLGEIDALLDLAFDIGALRLAVGGRHEEERVDFSERVVSDAGIFRIDLH